MMHVEVEKYKSSINCTCKVEGNRYYKRGMEEQKMTQQRSKP